MWLPTARDGYPYVFLRYSILHIKRPGICLQADARVVRASPLDGVTGLHYFVDTRLGKATQAEAGRRKTVKRVRGSISLVKKKNFCTGLGPIRHGSDLPTGKYRVSAQAVSRVSSSRWLN